MKAWILKKPYLLKMVNMPKPVPTTEEILVKIAWVGICGSDVEIYKGNRQLETETDIIRLGHEASGIVEELGENVNGFQIDDHVAVRGIWGCFSEYITGAPLLPTTQVPLGTQLIGVQMVKIPRDIPLREGSIVEVLPKIIKTVERAQLDQSKDVLILGQGVTGLLLTQIARLFNPRTLVATDLFDEKLRLSKEFGATHTINVVKENLEERVKELMPHGADIVFPAFLSGNGVVEAIELLKWGGKIMLWGCLSPTTNMNFFRLHVHGGDILASRFDSIAEDRYYCQKAIDFMRWGLVSSKRLITHEFPFQKLPDAMKLKEKPQGDVNYITVKVET